MWVRQLNLPFFQMLSDKHLICKWFCTLFLERFYCLLNPKFLGEQTLLIKAEHFQNLFGTTYGSVCRLPLMELSGTYDSIFMSWSCLSWFWRILSNTKSIHHKTTFGIESWMYNFEFFGFLFFTEDCAVSLWKCDIRKWNISCFERLNEEENGKLTSVSFTCLSQRW